MLNAIKFLRLQTVSVVYVFARLTGPNRLKIQIARISTAM